jgi:phosphoserine aminotransferase
MKHTHETPTRSNINITFTLAQKTRTKSFTQKNEYANKYSNKIHIQTILILKIVYVPHTKISMTYM